jgi:hypothetical protein
MNWTKLAVADVLIGFGALSAYAVYQHGVVGVFEAMLANTATVTAFCDLTIALGLVSLWLIRDARAHGVSPVPYLLVTLALGSVGPLLYLLRRPSESTQAARLAVRTA